jgi:hypothetical protein
MAKKFMPDDPRERKRIIKEVIEFRGNEPPMPWKDIEKKVKLSHGTILRMMHEEGFDPEKIRTRRGPGDWEKVQAQIAASGLSDADACEALGISYGAYQSYLSRSGTPRVAKAENEGNGNGNGHDEPRGLGVGLLRRITELEKNWMTVSKKLDRVVRILS